MPPKTQNDPPYAICIHCTEIVEQHMSLGGHFLWYLRNVTDPRCSKNPARKNPARERLHEGVDFNLIFEMTTGTKQGK